MISHFIGALRHFRLGKNDRRAVIELPPGLRKGTVPARYRGVWRRTLLQTPALSDITTTVFWLQGARWHADLRIPAGRPDFNGVASLADCSASQCDWLAGQQGFAGITTVVTALTRETCTWHRLVDFLPPAFLPDAGFMEFEQTRLVESGVHDAYLEHWSRVPGTTNELAVFECVREPGRAVPAPRLLLVAGGAVMHVRARAPSWPAGVAPDCSLREMVAGGQRDLLDFEISIGHRTAEGWQVTHSSLPWLEGQVVQCRVTKKAARHVQIDWNGARSMWCVREWSAPRGFGQAGL